jgi:hypothetical protein
MKSSNPITFETVSMYLDTLRIDPSLAVISIKMAAEHRNVTKPAIERMFADGRLTSVTIGTTRCVLTKDLIQQLEKKEKTVSKLKKILEAHAKKREVVFYEEIMEPLDMSTKVPADRKAIGEILAGVSYETYNECGILLSVIVHRKTKGTTKPGQGFFTLANELGCKFSSDDEFAKEQQDLVFSHYGKKEDSK